ncbi:2-hydroxy-3-keto-5-methylthiopentenyl-1-phosphate phosphatase [Priestia megaterium]|nr:2-hydroxy-3-keto-5-methylthiopentenyl-1-phosphate phosphatase [Priestia megaterium]
MSQVKIFCDFDGTITNSDNIISIMKKFAPPQWEKIKDDVLTERVSIQEGVGRMFSLLSTDLKEEIVSYILQTSKIRDGFDEFITYAKERGIPLYIVSGGIDFFVKPLLDGRIDEQFLYCNESDFSGASITITWPHSCDDQCRNACGCCKPSIIRQLATHQDFKIVIGDSITDLQAAKMADVIIARDFLIEKCEELELPYRPFATFHDVIEHIEQIVEVRA